MKTSNNVKSTNWQLQEAKAMFSEVIKESAKKPQIITVHGKETAVILSFNEFNKLTKPKTSLFEFIQSSPLKDLKLDVPKRLTEPNRKVNL